MVEGAINTTFGCKTSWKETNWETEA